MTQAIDPILRLANRADRGPNSLEHVVFNTINISLSKSQRVRPLVSEVTKDVMNVLEHIAAQQVLISREEFDTLFGLFRGLSPTRSMWTTRRDPDSIALEAVLKGLGFTIPENIEGT